MRCLGLDIGEARVGVAVSDPTGRVATPVEVLDARRLVADSRPLVRLAEEYEPDRIVVGLPLTMSGDEGPQARSIRASAERYAEVVGVPVVYWDERLSSTEARRAMREAGVSDRKKRGRLDMLAASLILQSYLDAQSALTEKGDADE